jgi:ApbE superfamily uncharacterized protein (UPF0280 family)
MGIADVMTPSQRTRKSPLDYREREYRRVVDAGLVACVVKMAETDLHILATRDAEDRALQLVAASRLAVENYIARCPGFARSLTPLPLDSGAPEIIRAMLTAALAAGVGPMAAVAGVIAESVGRGLLNQGMEEVIVENGGDLFVARKQACTVAVYAGESPLSGKLGIRLQAGQMPCGVCCSSGVIGHSLSLGRADAAVVVASDTALADAAATRLGNVVKSGRRDINAALEIARNIRGISGVVIVAGEQMGAWGDVELVGI